MRTHGTAHASWRKGSRSNGAGGACVEVAQIIGSVERRTSSHSNGASGECVEIAAAGPRVAVRDSKASDVGHLTFTPQAWDAFMAQARAGQHDL